MTLDRGSCSALAADLRGLSAALRLAPDAGAQSRRVAQAAESLADAMGGLVAGTLPLQEFALACTDLVQYLRSRTESGP